MGETARSRGLAPQQIPADLYRFAVKRCAPLVRHHLARRAVIVDSGIAPAHPGLPQLAAPTETDLAAAAYMQGLQDAAEALAMRNPGIDLGDVRAQPPEEEAPRPEQ